MSPLDMQILLACYVSPRPADVVGSPWLSPAAREAREHLRDMGMIDRSDYPRTTDKGEAWIKRALSTPMPRQAWVFDGDEP